jgi:hypothetical protein
MLEKGGNMYQLKKGQESFTPVEGPFARKTFAPGKLYAEIPPGTEGRFEKSKDAAPDPATEKPAKADSKRGASPSEKGEVS